MKPWVIVVGMLSVAACGGCTSFSLKEHTLGQMLTVPDIRYQETLNCIAQVAADPAALSSYTEIADGMTKISDMGSITSTLSWTRVVGSFATGSLGEIASRTPMDQWSLNTAADFRQIEAVRAACRWVLYGPEKASPEAPGLLTDPQYDHSPGPHFGIANRLSALPSSWLHVGKRKDVPPGACYKAHRGHIWVWIMPDGMEGLSQFTLIMQDIATLDVDKSLESPLVVTLTYGINICQDPSNQQLVWMQEQRLIKANCIPEVQREITCDHKRTDLAWWYARTDPDPGPRISSNASGSSSGQTSLGALISMSRSRVLPTQLPPGITLPGARARVLPQELPPGNNPPPGPPPR